MMRSFYEKNLKVMSIKIVVGLLLCSEDIEFFFVILDLQRLESLLFASIVILLEKYIDLW